MVFSGVEGTKKPILEHDNVLTTSMTSRFIVFTQRNETSIYKYITI